MKDVLHRIVSLVMAVLLLTTTTSWKVEKHYCMGHLVDVAFFGEAQDCGMSMTLDEEIESTVEKMSCCNSEVIAKKGQEDVKPSTNDFDLDQEIFFAAYVYSFIGLFEPVVQKNSDYTHYLPPKIVKDIQLLDAVFLI
ncbi:HYC_CC_PP family protein [Zobellia barbeyronii]|uniref:Secreted protein n=1 Tax=Zobellia barbeyronii TaxID=2748009 RepID=A0ABS5W8U0_9FLAO|nr:hypothetical protein [Zobellia barbeyronii]MBT2159812.1 hypothetical protein [Zobellia barbeyronii]